MTLIDIATYVCNLVNKTDDTSKTRCKEFIRQHHENVINSALWRETIDVEQTTLPFDGRLTQIILDNGGTGYTSAPTISFTGGGGSGATAAAEIGGGAVSLATAAEIIDPTSIVAVADAVGAAVGAPMIAKAWGYILTLSNAIVSASSILQNCTVSRTGEGAFTVAFATDVPSVKYMVMGNGRSGAYAYGLQVVSSSLATTGFTFVTVDTNDSTGAARDPDGGVQFVVYGLTS